MDDPLVLAVLGGAFTLAALALVRASTPRRRLRVMLGIGAAAGGIAMLVMSW